MPRKTLRIGLSVVVIGGALSFLLMKTATEAGAYYKHVNEVAQSPEEWYGKRMQLHGFVVDGTIQTNPATLEWRFDIESQGHVMKARYQGVVPDTFKDGSEVVLKGTLGPEGFHVQKDGVMAKCPSRYEADAAPVKR